MQISINKLTDDALMRRACEMTVRGIMCAIKEVLAVEDKALADTLVPLCEWRNGRCDEPNPCGWFGGRQ